MLNRNMRRTLAVILKGLRVVSVTVQHLIPLGLVTLIFLPRLFFIFAYTPVILLVAASIVLVCIDMLRIALSLVLGYVPAKRGILFYQRSVQFAAVFYLAASPFIWFNTDMMVLVIPFVLIGLYATMSYALLRTHVPRGDAEFRYKERHRRRFAMR